jgi:Zn-dependent protease with chaperone function
MDFFSAQDRARRNTTRLLFLFIAAVIALVVLTNLAVAVAFGALSPEGRVNPELFLIVTAVVCGGIALACLFKHLQLASGGKAVAEMLGGRLLDPASTEPAERRLLNVVEEMALAAGVPVPPVYVLPEEGINAFAAGHASADAVIGITEGSMRLLARDELQGVVAHEFSHVLNGDMRLNLRLIAVLHGILFIALAGRVLLESMGRSSRRTRSRDNSGLLFLGLGLALLLIGWVGVFFGRLIKAGVSREREYLADASAVQFTRNPLGLAGALRKIGALSAQGLISNPRAETASHLFFAQAVRSRFLGLFATHPPLPDRIRVLDPSWGGEFPAQEPQPLSFDLNEDVTVSLAAAPVQGAQDASPDEGPLEFSSPQAPPPSRHETDPALRAGCRHPELAAALALNALLDPVLPLTPGQIAILEPRAAVLPEAMRAQLAATGAVTVLELSMPALKRLDADARKVLIDSAAALAALDGRLDMREFAVAALLEHHLGANAGRAASARPRFPRIEQVSASLSVVLSVLSEGDAARFSAAAVVAGASGLRAVEVKDTDWPVVRSALATLRGLYPLQKPRVFKAFRVALGEQPPTLDPLPPLALALDCAALPDAA